MHFAVQGGSWWAVEDPREGQFNAVPMEKAGSCRWLGKNRFFWKRPPAAVESHRAPQAQETTDSNGKRRERAQLRTPQRMRTAAQQRVPAPAPPAPRTRSGCTEAASGRGRNRPVLSAAAAIMVRAAMPRSAGRVAPPRSPRAPLHPACRPSAPARASLRRHPRRRRGARALLTRARPGLRSACSAGSGRAGLGARRDRGRFAQA